MTTNDELKQRIETIETGYEFMLAYAAQGRQTDKGAAAGRNVREYLDKMAAALEDLSVVVDACASELDAALPKIGAAFFAAVDADARVALAAIRLALAREDISSQLVDNMNASIHLRALLTDLFVVDEVLKPAKARA
jgi:alkylation response protein AidB-like acyl-CoA dehydrogenase